MSLFTVKVAEKAAQTQDGASSGPEPFSADGASDAPFQVKVGSTSEVFTILPGHSITKTLEEQGVFIPVSCEEGVCGTCLTGVLEGTPDHRDFYMTEDEHAKNDQITPCCSRSKSAMLVLDI
jgi:vanillate O-demethylase ferredoxin subunit